MRFFGSADICRSACFKLWALGLVEAVRLTASPDSLQAVEALGEEISKIVEARLLELLAYAAEKREILGEELWVWVSFLGLLGEYREYQVSWSCRGSGGGWGRGRGRGGSSIIFMIIMTSTNASMMVLIHSISRHLKARRFPGSQYSWLTQYQGFIATPAELERQPFQE